MISVFGSKVGDEELAEVKDCFDRQWMGLGPKTALFEKRFAERRGLPNLILVNSGSNALHLAVAMLDLPRGSDVIVPSFTWVSCAHAVILAGHRPVFCDVDLETMNVRVEDVEAARTSRARAVMVVHYAGKPVRLDEIAQIGLPIIEDAAHAVDSALADRPCGGLGDVGVFSFDAVKNLAMGEGGAFTAKDPDRARRATLYRYCGIAKSGFESATYNKNRWWEYDISAVFPKYLPSDLSAAIGLAQLEKLPAHQARRRAIWERYQNAFADLEWLRRPTDAARDERHSYFTYVVRIPNRDRSAKMLYDRGIYTTLRYHPLHMNRIFGSEARLPNSERLNEEALSIPLHPNLSDVDVEKVITEIRALPRLW